MDIVTSRMEKSSFKYFLELLTITKMFFKDHIEMNEEHHDSLDFSACLSEETCRYQVMAQQSGCKIVL